jgi:hypothetical protein
MFSDADPTPQNLMKLDGNDLVILTIFSVFSLVIP